MIRNRSEIAVVLLLSLGVGCQKTANSQMPLHPVRGVVTKDGKPIKEAFVRFVAEPENQKLTINAMTDAEGKYELKTLFVEGATNEKKPGAPEGTYAVYVTMPLDAQQRGGEEYTLPDKYQVKPGANEFALEVNPKKK
ncbi:MAG TPA: carboxypeptidase-like regulatory domain-containing protein [Gemmataceae bacterium]|jgi:hypothetical protein|nr:carboxypeptidase-like regulatory domain-containing protein [Gemmataceae bacterium]